MNTKQNISIFWAILAAALYAFSFPISKILLIEIPPSLMASLLYLGAGIGMSIVGLCRYPSLNKERKITRNELPYIVGMVVLDIAAPILLMIGLTLTNSANISLLNNFEIVATSLIAAFLFKESISNRLWIGISLITIASILLSIKDISSFSLSFGSLIVLLACICWGFENNCTRMLSVKDPLQVVTIKGFGSGFGSLAISFIMKKTSTNIIYILCTLLLGFVAYGLSIFLYVYAQRYLGAAKTSAYYAISPFIGATLSFLIFHELPSTSFLIALLIMILGTYTVSSSNHQKGVK